MVQKKSNTYLMVEKKDIARVGKDLKLLVWYSALKDYAKRFDMDKYGYIRVPIGVPEDDLGMYKVKIWRYNKDLEDKGLIKVDRTNRGGHTWMGYRFI